MRRLFNLDSSLMNFLTKAFDCICLSVLWILFSLPVFTIGASSSALYTAAHRCLQKDEAYPARTFWNAFRENFKRSTLCWLIILAALALLITDAVFFRNMLAKGDAFGNLYWVMLVLICVILTWSAFLCGYCARCNGKVKEVLRISFLLMVLHPIRALSMFLLLLFCGIMALSVPGLILLLPAPICWLQCKVLEQVLRLHMRPEDLEKENDNSQ